MDKKNILTYEGLKKLEDELEDLKVVKRKEVSQKIKEAREQGDLSENAEYDAAKDEQRDIEARIEELEKILKNAEVFVEEEADLDKVSIGCQVKILDCEFDEELTYKIVGSTEANSLKGKISNESPVGKALLGKKIGDTVTVTTPAQIIKRVEHDRLRTPLHADRRRRINGGKAWQSRIITSSRTSTSCSRFVMISYTNCRRTERTRSSLPSMT